MTDAEIDALPAGRELDALVARDVLGARLVPVNTGFGNVRGEYVYHFCLVFPGVPADSRSERATEAAAWDVCPAYSTDIDAARTVFARLMDDGRWIAVARLFDDRGHLTSDPLAICRAALRAFKPR